MMLHGKHCLLRPPRYDEHRRLVRLRNENCHWFFNQEPITIDSHLEWYDRETSDKSWKIPPEFYCITLADRVIGTIGLMNIDDALDRAAYGGRSSIVAPNRAEYGRFLIAVPYRRYGHGTDALATVLHHAFFDLDRDCVYGYLLAHNEAALALDRKLGFRDHGSRSITQDQVAIRMQISRENFIKWLATTLS